MHSQHNKHTEEVQRTERFSSLPPSWGSAARTQNSYPSLWFLQGAGDGESGSRWELRLAARWPQKLACGLSVSSVYPQVPVWLVGAPAKKVRAICTLLCVCVCVCMCLSMLKKDLLSILLKSVTWDKVQHLWPSLWTTQLLLLLAQQQQPLPVWGGEESRGPGPWATPAEDAGPALCWQMSGAVRKTRILSCRKVIKPAQAALCRKVIFKAERTLEQLPE